MKRALILAFLFILCGISAKSATTFFPPLQPVEQTGNSIQDNTLSSAGLQNSFINPIINNYPDVARIEQTLFGRTYLNQNIAIRLSRIEQTLFTTTYPNSTYIQRIDNIISNFNQINKYPNISQNNLSRMESKVFSKTFSQNNTERRIERLEEQVFGAAQSGDIDSRYKALQLAVKNYSQNNTYLPTTALNTGWKGILGNIGNSMLGGTMTGFTPPINPQIGPCYNYNNYANPYMSGSGMYRGYGINRGMGGYHYGDAFSSYGSGMGATILD